jgi:hypothetical protein
LGWRPGILLQKRGYTPKVLGYTPKFEVNRFKLFMPSINRKMPPNPKFQQRIVLQKMENIKSKTVDVSEEERLVKYWETAYKHCLQSHDVEIDAIKNRMIALQAKLYQAEAERDSKSQFYKNNLEKAQDALNTKKNPANDPRLSLLEIELEKIREILVHNAEKSIASEKRNDFRQYEKEYLSLGGKEELKMDYDEWRLKVHPESKKPSVMEKVARLEVEEKAAKEKAEAAKMHILKVAEYKQIYQEWSDDKTGTIELPEDWDQVFYDEYCEG